MQQPDEEPLFHYSRLAPKLASMLAPGATLTCATVHPRFLAVGTTAGSVHVLELGGAGGGGGGEARPRLQVCASGVRVNDVCTDVAGDHIGSAADDGSVCISALGSDERSLHTHHRAVRAVRLAPDFSRSRERPMMTGGRSGRLNLLKKGWMFGSMAEKLVHEGEGVIAAIAWDGGLVAWANGAGVKVIDVERFEPVCFVAAPAAAPPTDICPARLVWESESSLLVCWGADVRVISIRDKPAAAGGGANAAGGNAADQPVKRFGEVTTKFTVKDALVCGIAPFGDELALLCYKLAGTGDLEASGTVPADAKAEVEMRIVARDEAGTLLFQELLPMRGLAVALAPAAGGQPAQTRPAYPGEVHLLCDDELTGHEGLPILFAVSPLDVVIAQPRGPADHAEWEFSHGRFHRAIAIAMANPDDVPPARRRGMVERYVGELYAEGDFAAAADVCLALVQPEDADGWNRWVCKALAMCSGGGGASRASGSSANAPVPAPAAAPAAARTAASSKRVPTAAELAGAWHFLRAAVLCYGIDVGAPPPFAAADGHVELLDYEGNRALDLDVRRAGGGATAAPLAPTTCTRALEFLVARDARTFVTVLKAVHARAAAVASKSGVPQAPSYDVDQTTFTVEDLLERLKGARASGDAAAAARCSALSEGLLELYLAAERFEDALRLLLVERSTLLGGGSGGGGGGAAAAAAMTRFSGRMFSIIEERRLYAIVAENVDELLGIDEARTLSMIAEHLDEFPVDRVAMQLHAAPQRLLTVLEHLFVAKEEAYNSAAYQPFLDVQVQLYAQFARSRLLPFLQRCKHYAVDAAEAVCAAAQPPLHAEHAFLLVKGGKGKEAVALQLDALGDVAAAVATANEFNDEDIWSALVQRTLQLAVQTRNGALVGTLLDSISNSPLDPVKLISRIPVSIPIHDLHERLASIIRDRRLHRGMVAICTTQCRDDVMVLITRMTRGRRQGLGIAAAARCALCDEPLARARVQRAAAAAAAAAAVGAGASANDGGDAADEAPAAAAAAHDDAGAEGGDDTQQASAAAAAAAAAASAPALLDAEDLGRSVIFFCQHAFHFSCLRDYQAKALAAAAAAAAAVAVTRPRSASRDGQRGRARGASLSGDRTVFGGAGGDGVFGRAVSSGSGGGRPRGRGRRGSDASMLRDEDSSSVGGGSAVGTGGFKASQHACPLCTSGMAAATA